MKKWLLICMVLVACKGKQGDKGDNGVQGLRGPGQIEIITGSVSGNDFNVFDSRISPSKQISVYLNSGGAAVEMPYFLPASGVNAYDVITPGKIEIVNGSIAGATGYTVILIL